MYDIDYLTKSPRCMPPDHGPVPRTGVLVVDDDALNLKWMARSLRERGHVYEANSADAAMRMLLDHDDIGVVVTDMRMPDHDGEWLIEQIGEQFPDVEIIVYSAFSEALERVRPKIAAAFHKPITDMRRFQDEVSLLVMEVA